MISHQLKFKMKIHAKVLFLIAYFIAYQCGVFSSNKVLAVQNAHTHTQQQNILLKTKLSTCIYFPFLFIVPIIPFNRRSKIISFGLLSLNINACVVLFDGNDNQYVCCFLGTLNNNQIVVPLLNLLWFHTIVRMVIFVPRCLFSIKLHLKITYI